MRVDPRQLAPLGESLDLSLWCLLSEVCFFGARHRRGDNQLCTPECLVCDRFFAGAA
ncbi:hypothetical protein JL2886_01948 [Phaeobacter gallaeciensis]|uniref:Uncharacterized protein n=1 Tax=Phaeobacter gallaeciensis TaxID=60890 RepID=A0A1B0ZRU0_9RHOB|nr:hypothetical protein JL2886_01948 [Phaeobacter gallaeciensis]